MNQNSTELVRAAGASAAPEVAQTTPAKTCRPRRMARETGAETEPAASNTPVPNKPAKQDKPAKPKGESKIARVIALLGREQGATLAELVEATGWLPHTTRAALTGLRKKGHALEKTKRGEVTCYKLAKSA